VHRHTFPIQQISISRTYLAASGRIWPQATHLALDEADPDFREQYSVEKLRHGDRIISALCTLLQANSSANASRSHLALDEADPDFGEQYSVEKLRHGERGSATIPSALHGAPETAEVRVHCGSVLSSTSAML